MDSNKDGMISLEEFMDTCGKVGGGYFGWFIDRYRIFVIE